MPFPDYPLATDRTNDTGTTDLHPADHNKLATAVNWLNDNMGGGGSLLDDPPFVNVVNTDRATFTNGTGHVDLTWDTPTFNGAPFVTVSGTDITFDDDCTVVVTLEAIIGVASGGAEGSIQWSFGGTVYGTSPFFDNLFGCYPLAFYTTTPSLALEALWTTPPFRAAAGATLTCRETEYINTGSVHDDGTQMYITRLA